MTKMCKNDLFYWKIMVHSYIYQNTNLGLQIMSHISCRPFKKEIKWNFIYYLDAYCYNSYDDTHYIPLHFWFILFNHTPIWKTNAHSCILNGCEVIKYIFVCFHKSIWFKERNKLQFLVLECIWQLDIWVK